MGDQTDVEVKLDKPSSTVSYMICVRVWTNDIQDSHSYWGGAEYHLMWYIISKPIQNNISLQIDLSYIAPIVV